MLRLFWIVDSRGPHPFLRLARDPQGRDLLPTEAERTQQGRAAEQRERAAEEQAIERIAELERRLRERGE